MKCPACGYEDSKVIDSRPVEENNSIKRRRECLSCHTRFTTYEIIDQMNPIVVKKDGSRELSCLTRTSCSQGSTRLARNAPWTPARSPTTLKPPFRAA